MIVAALAALGLLASGRAAHADAVEDRPDVLITDFEGPDYGVWKATGEAFGTAPAHGTLPGQMPVSGFEGKGLVNSYRNGDDTTGTLTSPPFQIERKYLNFLIGGGKFPGETCLNLLVDGKPVRTATGPNNLPGGTEKLDWDSWDVSDLAGKTAVLEIVDHRTGGWGHINVDQIVQSDRKRAAEPARREIAVATRYLLLPVRTGAPKRQVKYTVDGKTVREFDIELDGAHPGFFAFDNLAAFQGKTLTIESKLPADSHDLDAIQASDSLPGSEHPYQEKIRPQFHFTSRVGWLNDPNGLVYHDGEYHLFYQHNPYGWDWGNMHWGHAVSPDLFHWKELPFALYPKRYDDSAFSGSAVIDKTNTSGFGRDGKPAMVAAFTSTGRGECIVYSNDNGRTWSEFEGNPVVKHSGRDPRLQWFEPTRRWIMAVYDESDGKQWIAFHSSPDLKKWTFESKIEGFFECPELFPMPVDGDAAKSKWVIYAADGQYRIGQFDGHQFTPDTPSKLKLWHGNFYASQTFSNTPDGRRIQMGWGNGITFPGMPFNQQMTVPVELTLRTTDEGVRMFANPVKELASLHGNTSQELDTQSVLPDQKIEAPMPTSGLAEIRAGFEVGQATSFGLIVRGVPILYDVKAKQLSCGPHKADLAPAEGRIRLHILVDRGSIEVFGNDGRVAISLGVIPKDLDRSIEIVTKGGTTQTFSFSVQALNSAW